MWRRAYDIIRGQEGATKAEWVWIPAGWSGNWDSLPSYWPGNDYVNAVGYDPYRSSPPSGTPVIDTYGFYDHMEAQPWLDTSKLYYLVSEWGVVEGSGRPAWLRGIPASLKDKPKIRGVFYFDSPSYLTVVLDDAASQQAFADLGRDPLFSH